MANDIIDINVYETVETVSITVNPNLTTVNINQVTGGGGGGATDLGYIATPTNGTVTSSTGSGATIPLADGTNAGLFTPSEKTKLSGIAAGAEVNVNADWNAVSGDAQILNKPTIPSITNLVPYTGATTDVDLGLNDITAAKLIKDGGFDYQFLKADGSVDNNIYLTSADLPSTLDLYATTTASDISGYTVLVRNIADTRYNTTAVDVSTGVITSVGQLVGSLVTDANIISGNPGVFDFKTIGNISRTNGTGQAEFFFRIYKRNLAGTETLIAQSDYTLPVTNGGYVEFSATALWNDGIFLDTDRVVLKYYANRLTSPVGSDPTYQFQFGGASPVRSSAAIPTSVMPNIYLRDLADVENVDALNNEILYWNDPASLWEHSLAENLVPLATATQKGLVSTTTQTFAGDKTFTGSIVIENSLVVSANTDTAISAVSQDSNAISAEAVNGIGVYGSSVNGLGCYFNTVSGANIAEFRTDFVEKAKIDSDGLITGTGLNASGQTINTIASFDANKNVVSLPTATYPSLTELALVKGVSGSSIQTQLNGKQDTLQSTVNIKSINGNSILGSGDLTISGTGISSLNGLTGATQTFSTTTTTGTVIPAWTSSGTNHQLNIPIAGTGITSGLITNTSQFIGGNKVFSDTIQIPVPAGNTATCIVLGAAGGGSATSQLTIGSTTLYPNAQEMQYVKGITSSVQTQLDSKASIIDVAEQTYSLSPTFTITAPTTIVANTYKWSQVGSSVTVRVNLSYTTAGSFTTVVIPLPTDMPTPLSPTGFTAASDILYYGTGTFTTTTSATTNVGRVTFLRRNAANNGYEFVIIHSSAVAARVVALTLQYFT